jgi:hypothetical protein
MNSPKTAEIRIIGPRQSGKTTYLATLLCCPNGLTKKYPGLKVIPTSNDAAKLAELAKEIIPTKRKLAGTSYDRGNLERQLENLSSYDFKLKIPQINGLPQADIEVNIRDFPGEFFHDITHPEGQLQIGSWIEDLLTATGWIVMMTDWQPGRDKQLYYPTFERLCEEIIDGEQVKPALKKLKIAVVMAKCERGELWTARKDPDLDLFRVRLPKTYNLLINTFSPERLQFFACSSFGVLGDTHWDFDPRPNRYTPDDGSVSEYNAYLRNPDQWYPYGLISPLYWLATNKRIEEF